jgi:hypothetical protein
MANVFWSGLIPALMVRFSSHNPERMMHMLSHNFFNISIAWALIVWNRTYQLGDCGRWKHS